MWQGEFGLEHRFTNVYSTFTYILFGYLWVNSERTKMTGNNSLQSQVIWRCLMTRKTNWTHIEHFQMALTIQIESSSLKSCAYSARPYFWSSLAMSIIKLVDQNPFLWQVDLEWNKSSGSMFFSEFTNIQNCRKRLCKILFTPLRVNKKTRTLQVFRFIIILIQFFCYIYIYVTKWIHTKNLKCTKNNFLFTPDREQRPLAPDEFCLSTLRHGEWRPTRCTSKTNGDVSVRGIQPYGCCVIALFGSHLDRHTQMESPTNVDPCVTYTRNL